VVSVLPNERRQVTQSTNTWVQSLNKLNSFGSFESRRSLDSAARRQQLCNLTQPSFSSLMSAVMYGAQGSCQEVDIPGKGALKEIQMQCLYGRVGPNHITLQEGRPKRITYVHCTALVVGKVKGIRFSRLYPPNEGSLAGCEPRQGVNWSAPYWAVRHECGYEPLQFDQFQT